jgi:Na+-driven multidrug efflux pump
MSFVLDAFAVAGMAMIGSAMGTGDRAEARAIGSRLLALGFIAGVILGVGLMLLRPYIASFFGVEPVVEQLLSSILWFVIVLQPLTALVYVWDGIGIGASAFRFMGASMVVSAVLTIAALVVFGDTLIGVWAALTVLVVSRLVFFALWQRLGPLSGARDPSHGSQVAA